MTKYEKVIGILVKAREDINAILVDEDDELHRIRLDQQIIRDMDRLALLTGVAGNEFKEVEGLKPATTISGKPLKVPVKTHKVNLEPSQEKVNVLKNKVETAFAAFPNELAKDILKEYEDSVIRGVAKKVQMKVTKDSPAKLTVGFVKQIQAEITAFNEKQAAADKAKAGTSDSDSTGDDEFLK